MESGDDRISEERCPEPKWHEVKKAQNCFLYEITLYDSKQILVQICNYPYSYLSNKRVGYNKRVGWKIHPTGSTNG